MRLQAYGRGQLGLVVPLLALSMVLVAGAGGGGPRDTAIAAVVLLFPVIAFQVKMLADVEPDVQTELLVVAIGRRRQAIAALVSGLLVAVPPVLIALGIAAVIGVLRTPGTLAADLGAAALAHLVTAVPAVAIGLWSSRAVTRWPGYSLLLLIGAVVVSFSLDTRHGPLAWLVPPILSSLRVLNGDTGAIWPTVLRAVLWSAVTLAGYLVVRLDVIHRRLPGTSAEAATRLR